MAVMLGQLYQALIEAHAPEESARRAAEEVAAYENRFARIETELAVLKWMLGTNLVLTLAVLGRLLTT